MRETSGFEGQLGGCSSQSEITGAGGAQGGRGANALELSDLRERERKRERKGRRREG